MVLFLLLTMKNVPVNTAILHHAMGYSLYILQVFFLEPSFLARTKFTTVTSNY